MRPKRGFQNRSIRSRWTRESRFQQEVGNPMISYLKNLKNTKLIIVSISVNDDKTRYERLLTRRRKQEKYLNIEDFIIEDRHREGVPNNYENDKLSAIIDSAAYKIENDGDLNRFKDSVNSLIDLLENRFGSD